ncbi:universal stress protein [Streptomyces sp. F63]|uniref:universal stress protein n=1 Tax=Streptomyces sp. F63 TaxID=2824887 RepID=UPI001B370F40|nr:universal stress protein [Streptomyces sp. F63]MBQ0988121.1 universal stress protein [Streptomyces sp. F63]
MNHPVTVGLDGSPESLAAAEWAAGEALRRKLPLRLVHVRPPAPPAPPGGVDAHHWEEKLLRESREALEQRHPGLPVTTGHIVDQDPVHALLGACDEAGLLVLGSRGLSGMAGFLLGSVAMATVARAAKPVVLVRAAASGTGAPGAAAPAPEGREVVLGWDVRHPDDALVEFAFDAAERRGVPLRVVSAWAPAPALRYEPTAAAGMNLEPSPEELARERSETLDALLRPWREAHPGVEVVPGVPMGSAGRELVEAAADASLVVVGRRRTSALHIGPRLGSVAHAVLHHVSAPVAVVPHD